MREVWEKRRNGLMPMPVHIRPSEAERFFAKVKRGSENECWPWLASKNQKGYGQFYYHGRLQYTHRVAHELLVGPIPDGLTLDHLCRNRSCVNPTHLEPVLGKVNILRGEGVSAKNAFTQANTRIRTDGGRRCRLCSRGTKP